ncbi:hypothetical protein C8R47DRAFT_94118 [Mycena vitilis]|nr:hypothetical protein C8R47DRAFT_94118 [Mycena vitilis]
MVSSSLASTLFLLGLATIARTSTIHGHTPHHRNLAERIAQPIAIEEREPSGRIHRRRSCRAPGVYSSAVPVAATTSSESPTTSADAATKVDTPTTKAAAPTTSTATSTSTSKETDPTTAASSGSGTTSSSTSSSGGHEFTLINKCSSAVKPVVVSTACGYSPRCADASTAALPSPGSLAAGKTTTVTIPDNFVGRIFAQNGKCGASGEDCTMLEFNLDADSFYTPNSYDISNIQGFTQSISLGAQGCSTATCTSPSCTVRSPSLFLFQILTLISRQCDNAYPIGDMTGCGNDLPVKACGKGNIPFTVVFCP